MALTLIVGRSGSGKSNAIDEKIIQNHKQGVPSILITPDPATFEAENRLMDRLGGGLLDVEVLGLTRLAYRVLDVAGGKTRLFLSTDGKKMALRRILEQNSDRLHLYGTQGVHSGFIDRVSDLIRNFKYAQLDANDLMQIGNEVDDELLRYKLHDLAILYDGLQKFMDGKYIDAEDAQNLLVERIAQVPFFKETSIFVDGIPARLFSKQTYRMMEQLMCCAKEITMAICLNEGKEEDAAIFSQQRILFNKINQIAQENGIEKSIISLPQEGYPARKSAKGIQYLEKHLFTYKKEICHEEGVVWQSCANPREEVESIALYIEELLRKGIACGDIAIAMGNAERYRPLLRKRLAHLPLFLDEGRALSSHGVVELTMASMDAVFRNFRCEDVLRVAKSGFSLLSFEETEELENYVIEYGIRFSRFTTPFTKYDKTCVDEEERAEKLATLNEIRSRLIDPLVELQASFRKAEKASDSATAIFNYYETIHLRERLDEQCNRWSEQGEWEFANECAQVWNIMLTLLDQIASLMDQEMKPEQVAKVLEEGCVSHQIGMIPAQVDQITIGDIPRLSLRACDYLIIAGCNEGSIPATQEEGILVDDSDLQRMANQGTSLFFNSEEKTTNEKQTVYALFARAQKELYVLWSRNTVDGAVLFPSLLADRLCTLFPDNEKTMQTSLETTWPEPLAFAHTIESLREGLQEPMRMDPALPAMLAYWQENPQRKQQVEQAMAQIMGEKKGLQAVQVDSLYSVAGKTSVSRLETFNQCPFRHLVQYGFKPNVRKKFEENAIEQGNYYHEALDLFTREMMQQFQTAQEWQGITKEYTETVLDSVLDHLEQEHNRNVLHANARNRARAKRMRNTAKQTSWAMVQQIQAGEFSPYESEVVFGGANKLQPLQLTLANGESIALMGKIDRVDRWETEGQAYIRIIDYKTGWNDFTFHELCHGLKLQLPLYCRALKDLGEPAGMFYLHITESYCKEDEMNSEKSWEELMLKNYRLRGIVLANTMIHRAMDAENTQNIIPGKLKSDETLGKSDHLIPIEQMNVLLDYAEEKAIESLERIYAGETTPNPIDMNGRTSCQYCDYSAICRLEAKREGRFRSLSSMKADEFWAIAQKEKDEGDQL